MVPQKTQGLECGSGLLKVNGSVQGGLQREGRLSQCKGMSGKRIQIPVQPTRTGRRVAGFNWKKSPRGDKPKEWGERGKNLREL